MSCSSTAFRILNGHKISTLAELFLGPIGCHTTRLLFTLGYLKDINVAANSVDTDIFYAVIHQQLHVIVIVIVIRFLLVTEDFTEFFFFLFFF